MALLYIQCDWEEALRSDDGKAWITYKVRGNKGIRSTLKQMPNTENEEEPFIVSSSTDFTLHKVKSRSFVVKIRDRKFKVMAPTATYNSIHTKSISCLDVSDGGLGVSAGDDGMFVWETDNGLIRRKLEGHTGDVYSIRLFPSGIVILSSGADMRTKIWSAEDGSCPVTFTGHTAAVTHTAIVDRGRNIVTASKDGHIRLWNCAQQKTIDPKVAIDDQINCIDISESNLNLLSTNETMSEDSDEEVEVGTQGKILIVGTENGSVHLVDLKGRSIINSVKLNSGAVNSVKFLTSCDNIIAAGTDEGTVNIISLPEMKILQQIHDSDSSVQCLLPLKNGFLCGKYDGACVWYGFDSSSDLNEVLYEMTIILSGADVDPITDICRDYDYIYTSCRDGCIRKYSINNMFSGTS